jgi:PKD repeat protein
MNLNSIFVTYVAIIKFLRKYLYLNTLFPFYPFFLYGKGGEKMKIYFFKAVVLIIIGIFSIICVQSASCEEIEIDFSFTEPDITEVNISNTTYHKVTMNDTDTIGTPGCPMLPVRFVKVLLPQNGTLESINITYNDNTSLGYGYNVTISPLIGFNSSQQNESNQSYFNSSKIYPTELRSRASVYGFRGYSILLFNLYPVHCINDTGEIYYYKNMTVTIITNNTGSPSPLFRNLQSDETDMKQMVDDYSMKSTYTSNLTPPSETYDLLIITKENLINKRPWWVPDHWEWNTFQTFANEKEKIGIKTKIIKLKDIYNEYEGIDDNKAAKIRMFIRDNYVDWGLKYVLLGGDGDVVPARELYLDNEKSWRVTSDLYYACLDDDSYDNDGDKRYGEPNDGDHWPDNVLDPWEVAGEGRSYAEVGYDSENDIEWDEYKVGLFSPQLDLSGYNKAKLTFWGNYHEGTHTPGSTYARVIVNSTSTSEPWPPDVEEEIIKDFTASSGDKEHGELYEFELDVINYSNPDRVYIQFFFFSENLHSNKKCSFNVDNVKVEVPDGEGWEELLFESFEEVIWTYYKFSGNGEWKREYYVDDLDLLAEVYVGRAPVGNAREVNNFVTKTLGYEIETQPNEKYIKKALLMGLFLNISSNAYCSAKKFKNEIIDYCEENDYKTYGIPEGSGSDEYTIYTLYDADAEIQNKKDPRRGWKPELFRDSVNNGEGEGRSIINCLGHGGPWPLGGPIMTIGRPVFINPNAFYYIPVLSTLQSLLLANDKYFFMYSQSCHIGKFNWTKADSLAEYLTVKTMKGAFAVIMNYQNGRIIGWPSTDGPSQRFDREFFDAIFGENKHELGRANQDSKEDCLHLIREEEATKGGSSYKHCYRECYYQLNLFGDPSVSIKIPENNNAPSKPSTPQKLPQGEGWYTFSTEATDNDGNKVSYKWKWGNQECPFWTNYHNSSNTTYKTMWLPPGTHQIRVKSRDTNLDESGWSEPLNVSVPFNSNMNICSSPVVLGKQIQFYGQALQGAILPVLTWNYSFDDGNYSDQKNTTHTYGKKGNYNVTMTVTDNASITSNVTKVIKVVILKSDFDCSSDHGSPQETISFNDTSDGYNDITGWYWDFGDNSTNSSRNTTHKYAAEGVYNVTLNVTDAGTNYSVSYQTIYIDTTDPEITSFSSDLDEVGYGYNITITANLSDDVSGIKTATVNITYPDNINGNFTLSNINGNIYEYVFNDTCKLGDYSYTIWAVDHAENLNSSSQGSYTVLRSFGYRKVGGSNQSIWHTITGSRFMVNLKGVADNASVYIDPGNATSDFHYQCVIYRHNDSKLMGITEEKNISSGKGWQIFNFSVPKPVLINNTEYVIGCWADNCTVKMYYDNGTGNELYYDDGACTLQGHSFEGYYNYYPGTNNFNHEDNKYSIYCRYTPDNFAPGITNILDTPDTIGFGFNVNITTEVTDNASGVDTVKINISFPDNTYGNFTMNNNTGNNTYWYNFNETWLAGQYNYTIWTVDYAGNSNSISGHSLNVSAQATKFH